MQPAPSPHHNGSHRTTGLRLNTATLAEQVYALLRERILDNSLLPGATLREEALAQDLSVSRVPVREALRRLAAEGLVTLVPRQGAIVSSLTIKQFLDAYRVREALEALAIRLAVPHVTADDLAALETLQDEMSAAAAAGDAEAFFAANAAFHALFVTRSQNDDLQTIHGTLVDRMRRYLSPSTQLRGGMERSLLEHRAILDAVLAGDADAAARLVGDHIRVPQRILEAMAADGATELPLRGGVAPAANGASTTATTDARRDRVGGGPE